MPKRSKPRKPNLNRQISNPVAAPSAATRRRRRMVQTASILVIFALIATVLIGALASSPAKAAELSSTSTLAAQPSAAPGASAEPDTDGDGIPNNADPDIDGDGIVNGIDPDIDGDGIPNKQDPDPAGTNGKVVAPTQNTTTTALPRLIPKEFETPLGRAAVTVLIVGAGAAVIWARRKRNK